MPWRFPTLDYVIDLQQMLEHYINGLVYQRNKKRDQLASYLHQRDLQRAGKKQAFQSIREASPGLMGHLQITEQIPVEMVVPLAHGLITIRLPTEHAFCAALHCQLNGHATETVSLTGSDLELMFHDDPADLQPPLLLTQLQHVVEPREVAESMNAFWLRFWD